MEIDLEHPTPHWTEQQIAQLLQPYSLGDLVAVTPLTAGTVQTNLHVQMTNGNYVLRLYRQNRTVDAVRFEVNLLNYLAAREYPCPAVIADRNGRYMQTVQILPTKTENAPNRLPYALFEFVEGYHVQRPTQPQQRQLIEHVALLQRMTAHYRPRHRKARWNYTVDFCTAQATQRAQELSTPEAQAKLAWYRQTLTTLDLPPNHPMGVCHGDFHFSNVLFHDGEFQALLDFDDANYTYLTFDLAALIEPLIFTYQWDTWQEWPTDGTPFDFSVARAWVAWYQAVRPLSALEKRHLFDVLKLSILIDCLWFFARGTVDAFYEKRKLEDLERLGRDALIQALF